MVFNNAMKNTFMKLLIIIVFTFSMGACGVKPKNMEAPADVKNDQFPQNYPAE